MGLRAKPRKLNAEELWDYALRALGRRAQSTGELRQKLLRRALSAADVPGVLQKVREYDLADDRKFSEAFASTRLQNQGLGSSRVLRDLRAKAVPERTAKEAVAKTYAGTDERVLVEAYLRRKYRGKNLPDFLKEAKNVASAYRRLRTAGFSSNASWTVLKNYAKQLEEWTHPEEEPHDM